MQEAEAAGSAPRCLHRLEGYAGAAPAAAGSPAPAGADAGGLPAAAAPAAGCPAEWRAGGRGAWPVVVRPMIRENAAIQRYLRRIEEYEVQVSAAHGG
jgi:hypothetical protein